MTQIKSEKAGKHIDDKSYWIKTGNNTQTLVIHFAEAEQTVIIAETEAEERHSKELQELKDKFDCDKYHLETNHQIEMHEVRDKCFSDIKEFTAKWEASDRKMDALHLNEVKRLKNYIENILFEIARADNLNEIKRFVEINKPLSDILASKNN